MLPQIFIINMKSREDRMKNIDEQCKKLGIIYTRVEAINGKDLDLDSLDKSLINERGKYFAKGEGKRRWGLTLTPGAVGCALSHKKIWDEYKESSTKEPIIVLEDDINIDEKFEESVKELIENVPEDWDLIYLGSHIKPKILNESVRPYFVPRGQVNGTIGYIINKKGVDKLLQKCFPLNENQIDTILYSNFKKWKVYHMNPVVIMNRKSKSDVQW